jgi:hypothetical protein
VAAELWLGSPEKNAPLERGRCTHGVKRPSDTAGQVERIACASCETRFAPRSPSQKFCSSRCRYSFRDRQRFTPAGTIVWASCAACDEPFSFVQTTKPRKYCFACKPKASTPRSARGGGTFTLSATAPGVSEAA